MEVIGIEVVGLGGVMRCPPEADGQGGRPRYGWRLGVAARAVRGVGPRARLAR